ncbi:Pentatricopeptide repeat-containing protein, mitochondrial, partial [Glycine soja]
PDYTPTSLQLGPYPTSLARANTYQSMWALHPPPPPLPLPLRRRLCRGLQQIPAPAQLPQTLPLYNALLSLSTTTNKLLHGAYALVRRKGLCPDKTTYALLVNAWCSNGKLREAKLFLREMSDKCFNPPVRGRDLLVESAKEMVRNMIKQGSVPDVGTFNAVVETVSKENVRFCVDLYHEVCALGMAPDVNTYKIFVPTVSKDGMIDEAFRGQFDDAFCFFGDMKAKAHPPNRPLYTMLITMCGRAGKFVEAANYIFEMTEIGLVPISRCFDMVTDGLKNCGKHDLAGKVQEWEVSIRGV